MKIEKNFANRESLLRWAVGAAILGYGLYKLVKLDTARADIDLEPAHSPSGAQPFFDPHPHRQQEALISKNDVNGHRTHSGNGPGERNQIGGRASGKKARF